MPTLDREEYVEQAYFFRVLAERMRMNLATQDLLASIRDEVLATTKLPLAIDFMASELKHRGVFSPALAKLPHYFTPFQAFVIAESEREEGKFDLRIALEILRREAEYRAAGPTPQGIFLYEFESLCRNRLGYDRGLEAIAGDLLFDEAWKKWIHAIRRQVEAVEIADLVYVASQHYRQQKARQAAAPASQETPADQAAEPPALFGEKEGRIALANRRKEPLLFFSALQRQLGYPTVPRPEPVEESRSILPTILRRLERIDSRLKLLEDEQRGGIDIRKFYGRPETPTPPTDES